jgi:hypothetical protein
MKPNQPFPLSPATRQELQLLANRLETRARQESPGPLPHLPHGMLVFYELRHRAFAAMKRRSGGVPGEFREEFGWLETVVRAYRGRMSETRAEAEARRARVGALVQELASEMRTSSRSSDAGGADDMARTAPTLSAELAAKIGADR